MLSPFGFWTIQALNLSLCAIPKAGSSMNRAIVARAVGILPNTSCGFGWTPSDDAALKARGVTREYSSNTTNVAIVRDPWTRAVSSFADQLARGHLVPNSTFMDFLRQHALREYHQHHTGTAAGMCTGFAGARFDHVVDVEHVSSFARLARRVPQLGAVMDVGWEKCTGGVPQLYMVGSVASHANKDVTMPERLCTPQHLAEVCRVYARDYDLYARLGLKYKCQCKRTVRAHGASRGFPVTDP